ncbi:hypothetical protein, partial [Capnocytophaga canimorsus]|uniref:hypothetical protein n=1 Tax=Capnocytophaga canimorsus TaxID=28188 RepID=UPI001EE094FF
PFCPLYQILSSATKIYIKNAAIEPCFLCAFSCKLLKHQQIGFVNVFHAGARFKALKDEESYKKRYLAKSREYFLILHPPYHFLAFAYTL